MLCLAGSELDYVSAVCGSAGYSRGPAERSSGRAAALSWPGAARAIWGPRTLSWRARARTLTAGLLLRS